MLRLALISCLSALALLASAAPADAVERIRATFLAEWAAESYEIDQGELVTFFNADPFLPHGLVSDDLLSGQPLFAAPTIGPKRTRLVRGAPFLTTGSYQFRCPVHAGMVATLEVNSSGTPLPPDSTPPAATLIVRTAKLRALVRRRTLRVRINPSEATDVALAISAGGVQLRSVERTYLTPGPRVLRLAVPRKAARALQRRAATLRKRGRKRIRVIARASLVDVAGNAATATGSRLIKLPPRRRPQRRRGR